jgi:hypothetical protein
MNEALKSAKSGKKILKILERPICELSDADPRGFGGSGDLL